MGHHQDHVLLPLTLASDNPSSYLDWVDDHSLGTTVVANTCFLAVQGTAIPRMVL